MHQLPYPVAGIMLTPQQTLELSAVWACISIIASSIGRCRWDVYQPIGPGKRQVLYDDPVAWMLNTRPNPDMTAIGWREAMLMVCIPFGNSYSEIVRDGASRPAELWPLEADRVMPRRNPKTWQLYYEYRDPDGAVVELDARDVFHLRGPGLHGLMGDNVVARAAKSLAVAAAAERHAASYFGQGANPGGTLELPAGATLSDKAYARLKEDWAEKKKGPENAHKPMILEAGWKWNQASTDPQKSQLVESRQFSVEEICRWFNVPPHKVQHLLRATFSNIEHQSIEFVNDACSPWERRICQEADFKLFPQKRGPWRYTCIDLEPLKEGDAKSRAEAAGLWRQNGIKTANEIREREGMNHAGPDGDVLLVQSNLTTVQNIINPPKPPAPAAPAPPPADPAVDPATQDDAAAAVARQAVTAFVVTALERYARRLQNRRADLARRKPPDQVEGALAEERARLLPRLVEELAPAAPFAARALGRGLERADLQRAAELVDAGHPPAAAALKALPATCPRPG
jgi:HK97 family phage portal protein